MPEFSSAGTTRARSGFSTGSVRSCLLGGSLGVANNDERTIAKSFVLPSEVGWSPRALLSSFLLRWDWKQLWSVCFQRVDFFHEVRVTALLFSWQLQQVDFGWLLVVLLVVMRRFLVCLGHLDELLSGLNTLYWCGVHSLYRSLWWWWVDNSSGQMFLSTPGSPLR